MDQVFTQTVREIGRANGSVFLWKVIDTDPRNADDVSLFSHQSSGTVMDKLPIAMSLSPLT